MAEEKGVLLTPMTDEQQEIFSRLKPEHRAFLIEYQRLGGPKYATEAYLAVYDKKGTMSRQTAKVSASKLLKKANLQLFLKMINEKINNSAVDNSVLTLTESKQILSAYARRQPIKKMKDGVLVETLPTVKESIKAIELCVRMDGGFIDKQQVEMTGSLPVFVKDDVHE